MSLNNPHDPEAAVRESIDGLARPNLSPCPGPDQIATALQSNNPYEIQKARAHARFCDTCMLYLESREISLDPYGDEKPPKQGILSSRVLLMVAIPVIPLLVLLFFMFSGEDPPTIEQVDEEISSSEDITIPKVIDSSGTKNTNQDGGKVEVGGKSKSDLRWKMKGGVLNFEWTTLKDDQAGYLLGIRPHLAGKNLAIECENATRMIQAGQEYCHLITNEAVLSQKSMDLLPKDQNYRVIVQVFTKNTKPLEAHLLQGQW